MTVPRCDILCASCPASPSERLERACVPRVPDFFSDLQLLFFFFDAAALHAVIREDEEKENVHLPERETDLCCV